ncbi:MAG TPA: hydrogenase 4 subunit B [Amaricoccus sp.]|uniref:hydrogenase 4 subunit B n=1 Tax=Amaricoccus sp. TaxID=1872485 RepID=UPI002CD9FB3E|nr:hydrogenase 4 subunit B [Amaricoccus sp.]HRO13151.1 hydrogenase 4 subunit B [Amaricoccus sp.]
MGVTDLALVVAGAFLGLAPVAVWAVRRPEGAAAVYGAAAGLSGVLAVAGVWALAAGGPAERTVLPLGLPWLGAHFRLDALSGFFAVIVGIGGAAASLYAIGYGRHERAPGRVVPFYVAFLGAMALVLLADDAFSFLLAWEMMSLLSWALVVADHRDAGSRQAGYVYLSMAAFGTMALLLVFGLLAGPGGAYGFAAIPGVERSPGVAAAVLLLMLVGAGSKAGLVPLHVWLPLAHPAAPSHVSALMSGVMTKVALYGFVRVVFELAGPLPWWASAVVILIGAGTAVMGILFAIVDGDAKRVLAYSTIENVGVIVAALGLALAFEANGMTVLAALALTAGLFHAFNHMLFKSLLFMAAGAVLTATGRRELDRLGGLVHRMPVTAFLALVGVVAISALPPLNGFASEWLLFQGILQSPDLPQPALQFLVPAAGGMLALAAAVAAACFVRFYGTAFLGMARTEAAAGAREVDRWSLGAMAGLALLCVFAGAVPGAVLDLLAPAVEVAVGGRLPVQMGNPWLTVVPVVEVRSSYSGFLVLVFIAVSALAAAGLVHRFASRRLRRGPAWDCGTPTADPLVQYSAGGFAQPIRRVFGTTLLAARETVEMPPPGSMAPARHTATTEDLAWGRLYLPLAGAVGAVAARLNALQFLTIRRYLGLVFISLILLLVGLAIWN